MSHFKLVENAVTLIYSVQPYNKKTATKIKVEIPATPWIHDSGCHTV